MIDELKRILSDHTITSIFIFLAGALLTFALEKSLETLVKKIRTSRLKKKLNKESLDSMNDGDVFALAHGTPYWKSEDIILSNSGKRFIIEIPKQFEDELISNDPNFEFRKTVFFNHKETISDLAHAMQIQDLESRIEKHSSLVAKDLIDKQNAGRLVFNGEMLGIYDVIRCTAPKTEYRTLQIQTYGTDFFTYRLFASIYSELRKENHPISKVTKLEEIIKYKPFLSSFGLCTFVTLYNQTEIVLGKRSLYTTNSENKWHCSMNEAFSQTDFDDDGIPDLFKCHVRGLQEELNIQPRLSKKALFFFDLIFSRERFEMGITSLIYLEDFAFKDLEFFYKCAKDGEVETDGLMLINADKKKVKEFLESNDMTKGSKLALQLLMARVLNDALPKLQ
jgi:hypothetical protein